MRFYKKCPHKKIKNSGRNHENLWFLPLYYWVNFFKNLFCSGPFSYAILQSVRGEDDDKISNYEIHLFVFGNSCLLERVLIILYKRSVLHRICYGLRSFAAIVLSLYLQGKILFYEIKENR